MKAPSQPILAFAGLARSGKSTAARAVAAFAPKAIVRPLAHGLKVAAHALFGDFSKSTQFGRTTGRFLDDGRTHELSVVSGREIYQNLGDFARAIDPEFALRRLDEFQRANPGRHLVIDDLRTEAEAEWVLSHPKSLVVWVVPRHDHRSLTEIRDEATHETERLDAVYYTRKHLPLRGDLLPVTHGKPAMTGDDVQAVMRYYREVFG